MVARYWTKLFVVCVALSYLAAFAFLLVYQWVDMAFDLYDPAQYGVMYRVMASPTFWFLQVPPPPFFAPTTPPFPADDFVIRSYVRVPHTNYERSQMNLAGFAPPGSLALCTR